MAIALVATIWAATAGVSFEGLSTEGRLRRPGLHRPGHGHRCRDRDLAGPVGRDDRHARAHRDAAQLRRAWPPCSSGGTPPTRNSPYPAIHDVEVFVGVFIGAVTFTGSIVAYLKLVRQDEERAP
jgi:hypothetical protein